MGANTTTKGKAYHVQRRTLVIDGTETSLAIEGLAWQLIDLFARKENTTWQTVIQSILTKRPDDYEGSRAAWIRYALLRLAGRELVSR